jgi:hypothetical protein
MALFFRKSRAAPDLVTSEALARYGRIDFLGWEAAGEHGPVFTTDIVGPLFHEATLNMGGGPTMDRVIAELRRHVTAGPWEAVGAWRFARDFVPEARGQEFVDAGLRALNEMRITNLSIHLAPREMPRYRELFGPPPHDGFFGPPVFDSNYGPTRAYYFDAARAAGAKRHPSRLPSAPGVPPGPLDDVDLWDFGMLVARGPLLVSQDERFEPALVSKAVAAATNVDHDQFAAALLAHVVERDSNDSFPSGWRWLGSARFVEDYLEPDLAGSPHHVALIDGGLRQLMNGFIGISFPIETLSAIERDRLAVLDAQALGDNR